MKIRLASIDIFRALTMLLMIFVNDLWTLDGIPGWLEHTEAHEDGMGLADVVFPAFLFIVGLSIPFALKARFNRGDNAFRVFIHILRRSLALIVMGFFMVNQDSISGSQWFGNIWQIAMIIAFIMIWNDYPEKRFAGIPIWALQITGILVLFILALLYKSGPAGDDWMKPRWWGILGIIGWAYLVCAILYLVSMKQNWLIPLLWLALFVLNFLEFHEAGQFLPRKLLMVSASNHALVMSGILATQIFLMVRDTGFRLYFPLILLIPATLLMIYGFSVRPAWGISKIMATPSWTSICASISLVIFGIIYVITDMLKLSRWASIIMPAGRSTLTCYLLPGLVYPFLWPLQQQLPELLLTGIAGLAKSLIFALLIIILTGLLEKINIRLRI